MAQHSDLKGKVALVTGSTSGIGLGIARGLATRGCDIILNGFGEESYIKSLQEDFSSQYQCRAEYVAADLTKPSDIRAMCANAAQLFPGGVDILVNNAGFQHVSPIEQFDDAKWDDMIAVMLSAPFHTIKHLVPRMKEKGWGRIVNVSSVHGLKASPCKSAYVSAKHGVLGLTKVVALETAGSGVTCNALCPGFVDTPIFQQQVKALSEKEGMTYEKAKETFLASFHPSKQAVSIQHLADMVIFLCSDSASQMTGQPVVIDGAWTAK